MTPGIVKLLLPPRRSRGDSQGASGRNGSVRAIVSSRPGPTEMISNLCSRGRVLGGLPLKASSEAWSSLCDLPRRHGFERSPV